MADREDQVGREVRNGWGCRSEAGQEADHQVPLEEGDHLVQVPLVAIPFHQVRLQVPFLQVRASSRRC